MKHHIISIGISKHQNSFVNNLSYAAKDAVDFFNLFTDNIGNIGYKKLLIDSEATLTQIRTALGSELQNEIKTEDTLFFFYSGHGTTADDINNETLAHFLLPFDATKDITNSCISVLYLKEIFEKIDCKAKLVFIDSCFSGSINSKGYTSHNKKAFKSLKTFANTVTGSGNLTFTASKNDEKAIEDTEYKNGLFTYFLLDELQKGKNNNSQFAVLDIFTPISEQVTKRAKEKYNYTQTPTLNSHIEGNLYLPQFKKKIKITPQVLETPKYPELAVATFPVPELQLDNKEQQKIINDLLKLVVKGRQTQNPIEEIIFERFCEKLIEKIKDDWEIIFQESNGNIQEIPNAVARLEAASFQFIIIGGVVAVLGSERQMQIYSQNAVEILEMFKDKLGNQRAGLVALIAVPEIILTEIIYVVGTLCLARNNLKPLEILMKTQIYDLFGGDSPPHSLIFYNYIHYCDAFGSYSDKVNDHIRKVLKNSSWLSELAPKLSIKINDFQLQANFLLVMLTEKFGDRLWADFARWPALRIIPLVNKIKYDLNFRQQIAKMFEVKENEVKGLFMNYITKIMKKGIDNYWWESITPDDFLTAEERKIRQQENN